jgi:hypothetical protein
MAYKSRKEKDELIILRSLNARLLLSEEEKKTLYRLEKGYEGEVMFDLLTEQLPDEKLILNDLLLEVNGTKFQIDTTLITQDKIYLFEVKNFEGDYDYNNGNFESHYGNEIIETLPRFPLSISTTTFGHRRTHSNIFFLRTGRPIVPKNHHSYTKSDFIA